MKEESLLMPLACSDKDFELVKKYIADFELDDRQLKQEEFLTLHENGILIGFGRVREFPDFSEMCSLGIIPDHRNSGSGKTLFKALIKKAKKTMYLACIIPSYFEEFGFTICSSYPKEMQEKLNYCTQNLIVEEAYVVMKKDI